MSKYFQIAPKTLVEILPRDFQLQKFSRRWMPHQLSPSQRVDHVNHFRALLHLLQRLRAYDFKGMTTRDESSFQNEDDCDSMIPISLQRRGFRVKKIMITAFLPKNEIPGFGQSATVSANYSRLCCCCIFPVITKEKVRFQRTHPGVTCSVHMDNFRCHNGRLATGKFDFRKLGRVQHPASSPYLTPCDKN
jgi:hypothetical protein